MAGRLPRDLPRSNGFRRARVPLRVLELNVFKPLTQQCATGGGRRNGSSMRNYLSAIRSLIAAMACFVGPARFVVLLSVGLLAKIALLATFIAVIKLLVFIITSDAERFPLNLAGYTLDIGTLVALTCVFTTVAFLASGFLIYLDRLLLGRFIDDFMKELRRRNLERHFDGGVPETKPNRQASVKHLLNVSDPMVTRAGKTSVIGMFDIIKNAIISALMFALLAYESFPIFLFLILLAFSSFPFYVKNTASQANRRRRELEHVKQALQQKRADLLNGEALRNSDALGIKDGAAELVIGDLAEQRSRLEGAGFVGALSTYPLIYGVLGIAFSSLLVLLVADGLPIASEQVSSFVVLVFVLRFAAANVYGTFNGFRLFNSEYAHLNDILSLLGRPRRG